MGNMLMEKFMRCFYFLIFVFIISLNTGVALANTTDITGSWDSNWGKMVFSQDGSDVTGTYATSNGKIYGKMNGNILEGYWTQNSAGQKCSSEKYGSFYWGRIRFLFNDQKGSFTGSWGYCNNAPTGGGWTGKRKRAVKQGANEITPALTGTWSSNWGKMVFSQNDGEVSGTYATSNGEIFGTMNGNILEGYWIQSSAGQKCSSKKYGSYYWGRIKFSFDNERNSFSGKWGYCGNAPTGGGWTGHRK